jgi:hypothetical protein
MHSAANSRNRVDGSEPSKMWLLLSFGTRSAPASSRRGKSELIRRGLLIQANKLVICAYGDPLRLETRSCSIGKVWPRMGVRGMGNPGPLARPDSRLGPPANRTNRHPEYSRPRA